MYYQNYEDYMRSVLGYPIENQNTYRIKHYEETQNCILPYQDVKELEECYPEIYKIINPVVCEVCNRCREKLTKSLLENMVEEVYQRVEINNEISIKINIENNINEEKTKTEIGNRINNTKTNNIRTLNKEHLIKTSEQENRRKRPNNPLLKDLIRILILNRLLGGNFQIIPKRPMSHTIPTFSGEPRLTQFRNYEDYLKF